MFYPHIPNGAIVWEIGTLHGVQEGLAVDAHINFVDMHDQKVGVNEKLEDVATFETIKENKAYITSKLGKFIDQFLTQLKTIANDFPPLQKHLLSSFMVLRGKQQDMLAYGIASLEHPNAESIFLIMLGDNSFKRHRRMF